eukprot:CAMPEP_0196578164 /NCGR_PEP_ID=MMETSP1081-20130531/7115_1 /TAXON_ID=36882 /ORGANISM="Pyramimonas amylifera, Strain CCMP720" /LENGTH=417 /DNA_ID=CAMNT_0041897289 /DNA_START=11 /DNA_END=1260 /DNA_ORIENTATION=-
MSSTHRDISEESQEEHHVYSGSHTNMKELPPRPKSSPVYKAQPHKTAGKSHLGDPPQHPSESTSHPEENERVVVDEFCRVLDDHRRVCEATCKYAEADVAMNRLLELREIEEEKLRQVLRARHIAERVRVEEGHKEEFESFNAEWDRRMALFDEKAEELEELMIQRHAEDFCDMRRRSTEETLRPKFSTGLLNQRRIQATLAKQRKYPEAERVKAQADTMEEEELRRLNIQHQAKVNSQEEKLTLKQLQELEALRKRVKAGREEHKRQRQLDLERILQRYQNVKSALEKQQLKETADLEKKMKHKPKDSDFNKDIDIHGNQSKRGQPAPGTHRPTSATLRPASARPASARPSSARSDAPIRAVYAPNTNPRPVSAQPRPTAATAEHLFRRVPNRPKSAKERITRELGDRYQSKAFES